MSIKVSIGIPVYKVENYIERCARSLFEQTMKEDVEFIFVDDCSPDGSIEIVKRVLREYPQREDQVRIIRHERNLRLPSARNTFLDAASGEYLMAVDSDDFVDRTMVSDMYDFIVRSGADIVWEDYYERRNGRDQYVGQRCEQEPCALLLAMLDECVGGYTWNKIFSRAWLERMNLRYMPYAQGLEDLLFWVEALVGAPRVAYFYKAHYHYVQRVGSILHSGEKFGLESRAKICKRLIELVQPTNNGDVHQALERFIKRWKVDVVLVGLDPSGRWMEEYADVYDCGLPKLMLLRYWIMLHHGFYPVLFVRRIFRFVRAVIRGRTER